MKYTVLLIVLIAGCTPVATYPPVETDFAMTFSNSSNEPVPTIIAESLTYAHEHFGGMDTIVFNLPEGVSDETYVIVSDKLGGAVPLKNSEQVSFHIVELRKRPFRAEVDIVFPSSTGNYEQATLYLDSSIVEPWSVTRDRVWLVPISKLPAPNYGGGSTNNELVGVDESTSEQ
jgi:hypothetical protein